MPNRLTCLLILLAWCYFSVTLFIRDILPEIIVGPPPDLRAITRAGQAHDGPTRWSILVADDQDALNLRAIGHVETRTRQTRDGWFRMSSYAWLDSAGLLKGAPVTRDQNERFEIHGVSDVDRSGNLDTFRVSVALRGVKQEMLVLSGKVRDNELIVTASGALPLFNWRKQFPYVARQAIHNDFGPLDQMPGLQVGQRWSVGVVSPLTGRVQEAQVAVERRRVITWDANPVTTFEVATRMPPTGAFPPMTARTWVRPDGLVLRQELPFPFVRLVLERLPDRYIGPSAREIDEGP